MINKIKLLGILMVGIIIIISFFHTVSISFSWISSHNSILVLCGFIFLCLDIFGFIYIGYIYFNYLIEYINKNILNKEIKDDINNNSVDNKYL